MAAKLSNTSKPNSLINSFLPGLISFGCVSLFNGFYRAFDGVRGWHDPFTFTWAAIGIIMLALEPIPKVLTCR
jgi:hypothetical protein